MGQLRFHCVALAVIVGGWALGGCAGSTVGQAGLPDTTDAAAGTISDAAAGTDAATVADTAGSQDTATAADTAQVADIPQAVDTSLVEDAAPDIVQPTDVPAAFDLGAPDIAAVDVAPADAGPQFVVHEWGTFTGMQGSDGVYLDGLHHEEEPLPDFVYGRSYVAEMTQKAIEGLPEPCNQKMETPVLYFYPYKAEAVTVKVDFPNGVISQWYPNATATTPPMGALDPKLGQAQKTLTGGSMTWTVLVDPATDASLAPKTTPDSVWLPARNTKSTPVRFQGQDMLFKAVDEVERFIFYRGLGRFALTPHIQTLGQGKVQVHNGADAPMLHPLLMVVTADGYGGVVSLPQFAASSSITVDLPAATLPLKDAIADAKSKLKAGLVAFGLYEDEAQAMVDTWQKAWFTTPGARLLYILPQAWTDKLLPLSVTPKPDQVVRALVARVEFLTPEQEAADMDVVLSAKAKKGYTFLTEQWPHYLEPRLRRACQTLYGKVGDAWCTAAKQWAQDGVVTPVDQP